MSTILVAEDEESVRRIFRLNLRSKGFHIIEAENGRQALARIDQHMPDLVLLDIMMPQMNGYDVLVQLKANPNTRDLPVIVVSSVNDLESVVQCIKCGADDYLIKPFEMILLMARIEACLEKKRLRDLERQVHTELAASYQALQRAEHARDALTHMIVHDLNNPLTVIMGNAGLARLQLTEATPNREALDNTIRNLQAAAQEMSTLVAGILDVAKLEADQMPVTLQPYNAVQLTRAVYDEMTLPARQQQIQLTCRADAEDIPVLADKALLTRVVQNLIVNAIKHTDPGTHVIVSVAHTGETVRVSVEDDGPGIPAAYQAHIFDKYVQVSARREGQKLGAGLGLTFCQLAIKAQGGQIWMDSEEGKGTRFHIALKRPAAS